MTWAYKLKQKLTRLQAAAKKAADVTLETEALLKEYGLSTDHFCLTNDPGDGLLTRLHQTETLTAYGLGPAP